VEPIALFHVVLGVLGVTSIIVLFLQTVVEDPRIAFIALSSQPVMFLITNPGTNGSLLVGSLFFIAVLVLMTPIMFKSIKRPRTWVPLVCIVTSASLFGFELYERGAI
jgi:hypothetical protein